MSSFDTYKYYSAVQTYMHCRSNTVTHLILPFMFQSPWFYNLQYFVSFSSIDTHKPRTHKQTHIKAAISWQNVEFYVLLDSLSHTMSYNSTGTHTKQSWDGTVLFCNLLTHTYNSTDNHHSQRTVLFLPVFSTHTYSCTDTSTHIESCHKMTDSLVV